ncbi:MAG: glycosyltransferase family 2 protein [Candidatus Woesearchaeota archaeon]
MKIFITIAAYNEGRRIAKVISGLKHAGYKHIVVVDDGSKDNTYSQIKMQNVHALKHVINRGQGAALKTGITYALNNGADIIVTFDADGQHRVEDIPSMIKPILMKECDVTIGSRFLKKTNMPLFRRITLKTAIIVMWVFYGVKMTDAHNGFRAMSRDAAKKINITSDRMEHASQIIEEIHRKKIKYKEVPVIIKYTDYSLEKGHGGIIQAIRVFSKMIIRNILN